MCLGQCLQCDLVMVVWEFILCTEQENAVLCREKVQIEKAITERIAFLQRHKVRGHTTDRTSLLVFFMASSRRQPCIS